MLTAVPKSWFSWNFWLREPNGNDVGEVLLSSWRERGSVLVNGRTYKVYRESMLGPFVMEAADGTVTCVATKPSAFLQSFVVSDNTQIYELKAVSAFRRKFDVLHDGRCVGSIVPDTLLGRRASLLFTDEIPPVAMQAFLAWLTLLLWKRASDASAAG